MLTAARSNARGTHRIPAGRPHREKLEKSVTPAFRRNKRKVRYAGRRWRLVDDRGRWVLIERGMTINTLVSQWVPSACVR